MPRGILNLREIMVFLSKKKPKHQMVLIINRIPGILQVSLEIILMLNWNLKIPWTYLVILFSQIRNQTGDLHMIQKPIYYIVFL